MYTAIDLFAGSGGATVGLKRAQFAVIGAVELDPIVANSYRLNHPRIPMIEADIGAVTAEQLRNELDIENRSVDLVVGCPPCQGFSTHRLHQSGVNDSRNELVAAYAALVCGIKPNAFVFENVPGILTAGASVWGDASRRLEEAGYRIASGILDAVNFGVPQRRRRFVALGLKTELGTPRLPEPTHCSPSEPRYRREGKHRWATVADALSGITADYDEAADLIDRPPKHTETTLRRIAAIPKNGGSRSELPQSLQLECHETHDGHKDVYGRLHRGRPSVTITGGCTQPSKGRFIHPTEDRGLTLREASRLQGFPRSYRFDGNKFAVAQQIGNAVPPRFAKALALEVRWALEGATLG